MWHRTSKAGHEFRESQRSILVSSNSNNMVGLKGKARFNLIHRSRTHSRNAHHQPFRFDRLLPFPPASTPLASVVPFPCTSSESTNLASATGAFFVSTSPTTAMLLANHCWKGLAIKYPSAVNHVVKGALICQVLGLPELGVDVVTVR